MNGPARASNRANLKGVPPLKPVVLLAILALSACGDDFPQDRAEACVLKTAQDLTAAAIAPFAMLQSLGNGASTPPFDIGKLTFADVKFGTCTAIRPDQHECTVEYQLDFSGDGAQALVDIYAAFGVNIEQRVVGNWVFLFGPTTTSCNPI